MNRKLRQIHLEELRVTEPRKAHPDEETLELYALGRLDEPELGELEEHILICSGCQERLDEATEYIGLMRVAAKNVAAAAPAEPAWRKWFRLDWLPVPAPALAGAMAVLVALLVWQPWRVAAPSEWRSVELATLRGDQPGPQAVEGVSLELRLDITGLDATGLTVRIVSAAGAPVAELPLAVADGKAVVKYAPGLAHGPYWVRLTKSGESLREYALVVSKR